MPKKSFIRIFVRNLNYARMRLVIQRVKNASVSVCGEYVSEIGPGLMILVGIETGDNPDDLEWIVAKVAAMRIFNDSQGIMNLSVMDLPQLQLMAVSQFTLTASTRKGNRPSYIRAARPEIANPMYDQFCIKLEQKTNRPVARGVFGADMQVSLVNDGPVTIIIDSKLRE